jgi:uncharacterized protein
MVLMAERAADKEQSFVPVFLKRQAALLLFGILHVLFFWYGDILIMYAVIGLIMLSLYRLNRRVLLIMGIVLITAYSLFMTTLTYEYWRSGSASAFQSVQNAQNEQEIAQSIQIYSEGSFIQIMQERIREWN